MWGDSIQVNNPRYQNQGIHLVASLFTIDRGIAKVLLIKRKNLPFKDMWALVGGALYNDEEVIPGMAREVKEKTGITNIHLELFDVFSKINRCQSMRMVALAHIGIVDKARVSIMKETLKTSDCDWFPLDNIPPLAYDHNEILNEAIEVLKRRIKETDFLKYMYPDGFTMPEIQKVYESILNKEFDRRNFRKKLLSLGLIEDTNRLERFDGNKPAKVYHFKNKDEIRNVF